MSSLATEIPSFYAMQSALSGSDLTGNRISAITRETLDELHQMRNLGFL